jgi:hypothetical protein
MWTGSYGWLDILHSVNMLEYQPGKFVNFIALGHQFNMGDFKLQLDWMNRADINDFGFNDFSVMADLSWSASDKLNVFGKYSYDVNKDNMADYCVLSGTELSRVGAGVEYFPSRAAATSVCMPTTAMHGAQTATSLAAQCLIHSHSFLWV